MPAEDISTPFYAINERNYFSNRTGLTQDTYAGGTIETVLNDE